MRKFLLGVLLGLLMVGCSDPLADDLTPAAQTVVSPTTVYEPRGEVVRDRAVIAFDETFDDESCRDMVDKVVSVFGRESTISSMLDIYGGAYLEETGETMSGDAYRYILTRLEDCIDQQS